MATVREIEALIAELSPVDKEHVLRDLLGDFNTPSPGIVSTPGVNGGEPSIIRTRIAVWLLVQARLLGASDADILRSYPNLFAEDLVNAWAYYRKNRSEIDAQIAENEAA